MIVCVPKELAGDDATVAQHNGLPPHGVVIHTGGVAWGKGKGKESGKEKGTGQPAAVLIMGLWNGMGQ